MEWLGDGVVRKNQSSNYTHLENFIQIIYCVEFYGFSHPGQEMYDQNTQKKRDRILS